MNRTDENIAIEGEDAGSPPSLVRLVSESLAAGALFAAWQTAVVSVVIAGFNSDKLVPGEFSRYLVSFLWWLVPPCLYAGAVVAVIAVLISWAPRLSKLSFRVPAALLGLVLAAQAVILFWSNPYLFQALWRPASILTPLLLAAAISAGFLGWLALWRKGSLYLTGAAAVFLAALALLPAPYLLLRPKPPAPAATVSVTAKPPAFKVVIIGLDGMDWDVADPLLKEGRMPNLSALIERGVRAPLKTLIPTKSPVIWNTVATGRRPVDHGIRSFTSTVLPRTHAHLETLTLPRRAWLFRANAAMAKDEDERVEPVVPVNSGIRRAKTLWNIASDGGLSCAAINWWTTWPAERINGLMVSDRVVYFRDQAKSGIEPASSGLTWPPDLISRISPLVISPDRVSNRDFLRYMDVSGADIEDMRKSEYRSHDIKTEFAYIMSMDESIGAITRDLMAAHPGIQFWAIYFRGVDLFSHAAMQYSPRAPDGGLDVKWGRKYTRVLETAYEDADRLAGEIVGRAGPDAVYIVLSDHGFERQQPPRAVYGHDFAPDGVLVMAGGPVAAGAGLGAPSVYDIAPTVLYLLGFPVGEDMPGRVLIEALDPAFTGDRPVTRVPSFGAPDHGQAAAADPAMDAEILEHLRAIGYIQ